jgi:hypothetical protein
MASLLSAVLPETALKWLLNVVDLRALEPRALERHRSRPHETGIAQLGSQP